MAEPDWLADLPPHWRKARLKFLADRMLSGGTPSTDEPAYWDGDIPWVSPKDMKSFAITETEDYITAAGLQSSSSRLVPTNAVLIVVRSGILRHTIPIAIAERPVAINQDIKAIIPSRDIDPAFFGYFVAGLQNELLHRWRKPGTTVESIEHEYLANDEIPLPPLSEQRAIAALLDERTAKIDALIAKKEKLLVLLAEKRQAIITQAVTKGLDPTVSMKDTGVPWLGRIPEHWDTARLRFVTTLESGHTPNRQNPDFWEDCDIPWVSLNDSKQLAVVDYIYDTAIAINSKGLAGSSARVLPEKTVIFTRDATIGLAAITARAMAVSQHLIAWVPGPKVSAEFVLAVLYAMRPELDRFTFGATIKTIGLDDVRTLTTPVPPQDEQRKIAEYISSAKDDLRCTSEVIAAGTSKLREFRSALITAAVTGKIDPSRCL